MCVRVSLSPIGSYGVQGYPTIKIFGSNKKRPESYDGARVSSSIVEIMEAKAMDFVDPPEVVQLKSEQIVKDNCEAKQICLVAFLPHILDSVIEPRRRRKKQSRYVYTCFGRKADLRLSRSHAAR